MLAAALAVSLWGSAPAQAHPLGDPQQAELSLTDERTVVIHWVAPSDDLAWLALELGLLPEGRILLDGAVLFEEGDNELLAGAPEFEAYLLEHIAVSQAAGPCQGAVSDRADVGEQGVTMTFACAEPVTTLDVRFSTLTDLDSRYTTEVTSPDGTRFLYDGTTVVHAWDLSGSAAGSATADEGGDPVASRTIIIRVLLGFVALVVLAGGALWWRGRRTATSRTKK